MTRLLVKIFRGLANHLEFVGDSLKAQCVKIFLLSVRCRMLADRLDGLSEAQVLANLQKIQQRRGWSA